MAPRRLLAIYLPAPADLGALALWCQQFTPLTAAQPPDGVLLDITGCAHLFGGEAGLKSRLLARLPGARLAIAATAAAAWGLARHGETGSEDLAPLPLAALGLDSSIITRLRRVGVRRVGELARLPRAELTAGYGAAPVRKLAEALGQAPEVLQFCAAPPDWRAQLAFAEPIFTPAQLQAALQKLAHRLCARLADAQAGATLLTASFYRIDRQVPAFSLSFASPCRDAFQITRLAHEKLAEIDPGFGIEALSLAAAATEPLAPLQLGIAAEKPDYAPSLNTLLNRLGRGRIWRAAPHATHIPEYAVRRRPVSEPPAPWPKPRFPRPIRLLRRPEEITAIAPVPDDPPVFFTWRGQGHKITRATGPERIARDWWRHSHDNARPEAEQIRDYYAVEDNTGARFWLFRAGKHGGVAPARWYLHGFFG